MSYFCQSETKALENLLNSSERIEPEFETAVSNNKWGEVCSWQQVSPVCHYVEGKINRRMKKKTISSKINKENNKGKCKNKKVYHNVGAGNQITQNKCLRSTNVLSYDIPSWRFIMDSKDFDYVDRYSPKDEESHKLFADEPKFHQNGVRSTEKMIDPAGLLDENLFRAHNSYKSFNPDIKIQHFVHRLLTDNQKSQNKDVYNRLYSRSVVAARQHFDGGESDENSKKHQPFYKGKVRRSKSKCEKKKQPEVGNSKLGSRASFCLPKVANKQQLSNNSIKDPILNSPIDMSRSEKLYLPLLNRSNYYSTLQMLNTPKVQLPSISGVKICISSTSNNSLIL